MAESVQAPWRQASAVAAGARHLEREEPCQDAAATTISPRASVVVCDGKGSSPHSHIGSRAAAAAWAGLLEDLDRPISDCLDAAGLSDDQCLSAWHHVAVEICRRLGTLQVRLASEHGHDVGDLGFTLAAAVVGRERVGWLQVGDATIVLGGSSGFRVAALPEAQVYANWTCFLTPSLDPNRDLCVGVCAESHVDGVAAITDGMGFHLVDWTSGSPARAVGQLFDALRNDHLESTRLGEILAAPRWSERSADDRGLAMVARVGRTQAESPPQPDAGYVQQGEGI